MRLLTTLPHGSIPFDDEHTVRVDAGEVRVGGSHDRVEPAPGPPGDRARTRFWAGAECGIGPRDDDLPARELERRGVDPGEAELEHAAGSFTDQVEDRRRGGGGGGGGAPGHARERE